jgi:Protein of unknown function (DUF2971)
MKSWQRSMIRKLFPYSVSMLDAEGGIAAKSPHIPSFLYKYRNFSNKGHFEALKRGTLFAVPPEDFNDPYDTAFTFDTGRFLIEDRTAAEFLEYGKRLKSSTNPSEILRTEPLVKPIQARIWNEKVSKELLGQEPTDDARRSFALINALSATRVEAHVREMVSFMRRSFSVLSLSEDPSSILMWSHYADNHKGFCIQYDFSESSETSDLRRYCFPVLYRKKLIDATKYMQKPTETNPLFGQFMSLIKSDEWKYEKEWRIIYAFGSSLAKFEHRMPKPSAIILGSHISKENCLAIKDYCNGRGIRVKKAELSPKEFRMTIQNL